MIKNIIFDFGKVLVDYDFEPVVRSFFDNKQDFRKFYSKISSPEFIELSDREDIPYIDLIRRQQELEPQFSRQWQLFYDHNIDFVTGQVPGMQEYMLELRERGYHLYGLSNWCSLVREVMQKYPIFNLLDGSLLSSEIRVVKPYPEIYTTLLRRYNLLAEECVFTDDREANIRGGEAVGIRGILFRDASDFRQQLEALL